MEFLWEKEPLWEKAMNDVIVAPFLLERRLDINPEQARSSTKDSEEGI